MHVAEAPSMIQVGQEIDEFEFSQILIPSRILRQKIKFADAVMGYWGLDRFDLTAALQHIIFFNGSTCFWLLMPC